MHVEASPEAAPRLDVAVDLARKCDATLVGLGAEMFQTLSDPYGMFGGEWVVELQRLTEDSLKRAQATFKAKTGDLQTQWLSSETFPGKAMARLARSADLIVAGGAPLKMQDVYRTSDTAELFMTSGRPVLVAPPAGGKFHGDAVVIAWKDTRESRRAVADSLPLLKAAEAVVVLEVCEMDTIEDGKLHTAEVVQYLNRHGIAARAKAIVAQPQDVSMELNNLARTIDADLIVAGAYGHTRMGEWAFGGVTYELLHSPERFVLLSH